MQTQTLIRSVLRGGECASSELGRGGGDLDITYVSSDDDDATCRSDFHSDERDDAGYHHAFPRLAAQPPPPPPANIFENAAQPAVDVSDALWQLSVLDTRLQRHLQPRRHVTRIPDSRFPQLKLLLIPAAELHPPLEAEQLNAVELCEQLAPSTAIENIVASEADLLAELLNVDRDTEVLAPHHLDRPPAVASPAAAIQNPRQTSHALPLLLERDEGSRNTTFDSYDGMSKRHTGRNLTPRGEARSLPWK